MFFCKFSAWLLLLLLALNCRTTLEQYLTRSCLLRACAAGSSRLIHGGDANVVSALAGLMPLNDGSFYCFSYDYLKYSKAIQCDCTVDNSALCRVTFIDFSNQGLVGELPENIGSLTYLRSLDLSGNQLCGAIPDSMGNLRNLSFLDLCDNKLEGRLPPSFGQMTSLQGLYLCSNRLNGSIPHELGTLPSLQHLNIRFNSLTGRIPNELGSISSLILLDLHDNQLEGELPEQLGELSNLQAMFLMNNNFTGKLPWSIGKLKNLKTLNIQGNNFDGTIQASIADLQGLEILWLIGNNFQGPFPSKFSATLTYLTVTDLTAGGETGNLFPKIEGMTQLRGLTLRNCSLYGAIPEFVWKFQNLSYLDLSFNLLTGDIPATLELPLKKIFLRKNKLNGLLPGWVADSSDIYVDVSENNFTKITPSTDTISPNVNLFACCSNTSNIKDMNWQEADYYCANNTLRYDHLYINCGGNGTLVNGSYYDADLQPNGGSTFFLSDNKAWGYSSVGTYLFGDGNQYIVNKTCNISMADAPLYTGARVSPISLKYYGFCLRNDEYTIRLHFAEIGWDANKDFSIRRNRVFDVEIQGEKRLRDFNIEEAAGGLDKDVTMEFNASVNNTRLEIHFYWTGKGSTTVSTKYYGPLISAISVSPVPRKLRKFSSGAIIGIAGSSLLLVVLIIALFHKIGWLGGKRPTHDGIELCPGHIYSFQQIKDATNNFDSKNKIGDARGAVYKGVLPDGVEIAVKRLLPQSKQGVQDIITEIGTVYTLQHQNLARPIVCCPIANQILLVYKYMENISLEHVLAKSNQHEVKICLGIAKGLAFLHEEAQLHTIIHGNIKPSNILLDKDFDVKISDFGYSQLHDAQSKEQETTCGNMPRAKLKGYMAPEYIQGRHLTPKVDVYSFGIITLELVSGQNNITFRSIGQNIYLLNMAYQYQKQNNLIYLVDQTLGSDYNSRQANIILDLAMDCVSPSFDLRPTMSHAVQVLEGKIKLKTRQTNTPPPLRDLKMAEPLAASSRSTQSGSASQEGSDTALSLSTSKEMNDDSVISPA